MKTNIIFAIGGAVVGLAAGVLSTKLYYKKKYEKISDKEIEDMKEYWQNAGFESLYGGGNDPIKDYEEYQKKSDEEIKNKKEELKQRITDSKNNVAYNKIYVTVASDENTNVTLEDKANEAHEENRNQPPRIIREEELGELPPNIDSQTLYLYTGDGTITDDCDNIIDEPGYLIGKVLDGIKNFDDYDTLFILNNELDVCYEMQIIDGDYREYRPSV